jgi:NADPH-dependent curcumin reductase
VSEGKLHIEAKIFEGFEKAPVLLTMFTGKQPGKMLLKIGDRE